MAQFTVQFPAPLSVTLDTLRSSAIDASVPNTIHPLTIESSYSVCAAGVAGAAVPTMKFVIVGLVKVLFVNVSVVALPTSVSLASGNVYVRFPVLAWSSIP